MKRYRLLLAALFLILCAACRPAEPATALSPSPLPAETPSPTPAVVTTPLPTPEPTPEPEPEPTPELSAVSNPDGEVMPSTVSVDISDPDMYRKLNIFLSNFSESHFGNFSIEAPDYSMLARFAFTYAWINNQSLIEDCDISLMETLGVNSRISEANINKVMNRFFGDSISAVGITNACMGGYYYDIVTNGVYGYGFTLADSVTDLGENRFEVQFHTYEVPNAECPTYDSSSGSAVYSAHPDSLPEPSYMPGYQYVATPGSAVIEATQKEDGTLSFLLRTYTLQ